MIPGFSAAPMFIRKSGGPAVTGRVKFIKEEFDANNYALDPIDIEIYTNSTGYDIEIGVFSLPDVYYLFGVPSPYGFLFAVHDDNGEPPEYSYSSATLGAVTLASPVFVPDIGYWHASTSGVVAGFAADVWYDFSITV